MNKPLPPTTTRREAFATGRVRYYTGLPCKQGHIAERYVSTGGCVDCHNPYKLRRHAFRKDLQPYVCPKLWVPIDASPGEYAELEAYLATCVETFFKHKRGAP